MTDTIIEHPTSLLPDDTLLAIFAVANRLARCDDRFRSLILSGAITSTYYSPRGHEIIAAAFSQILTIDDYCVTTYRGLYDQLAKGVPMRPLWAEYIGKATGTCSGKGGPMHITHPESGLMVTTGIVGGGLPIAVGLGLSAQTRGAGQVTVVNFGDGATNIGAFHEAMNLAGLWKLPVVFCCQNNLYAEHTALHDGTSVDRIADRAAAYNMPGVQVDGNSPDDMYAAASHAVHRARSGHGPTLIDALTFRFHGHILSDDNSYMKPGELDAARAADPVRLLRERLVSAGHSDQVELIEAAAIAEIDDAVQFALDSPEPDLSLLYTDVATEVLP